MLTTWAIHGVWLLGLSNAWRRYLANGSAVNLTPAMRKLYRASTPKAPHPGTAPLMVSISPDPGLSILVKGASPGSSNVLITSPSGEQAHDRSRPLIPAFETER